jgi:hypothetical protein
MAKRNSQAQRNGNSRQTPAWAMVLLGVALGAVGSLAVLYGGKIPTLRGGKNLPQPNPEAVAPKESEKALADETAKATPPAAPKNNYDFYSVLPEKEVVIPDSELSAKAKAEQQRAKQQAQANVANNGTAPHAAGHRDERRERRGCTESQVNDARLQREGLHEHDRRQDLAPRAPRPVRDGERNRIVEARTG